MPTSRSTFLPRYLWFCVSLGLLLGACAVVAAGDKSAGDKTSTKGPGLYDTLPEPMTVTECGRCHLTHFTNLREDGEGHRFACQDCHQVFHAYNPRRNNYDELMPDCGQCHVPLPHGDKIVSCLDCHQNPHAPLLLPSSQVLGNFCRDCHQPVDGALQKAPSAHTELACHDCHSQRHGLSPACAQCHQPHLQGQLESACRQCHLPHQPLLINLSGEDNSATCGVCHGEVHDRWASTRSRHGQVNCNLCHVSHRHLPACTDCHVQPHEEKMLSKFPNCLACHGDVHDMPVNR